MTPLSHFLPFRPLLRHLFLWVMTACWDTNLCLCVFLCVWGRVHACVWGLIFNQSVFGVLMHISSAVKHDGSGHLTGSNASVLLPEPLTGGCFWPNVIGDSNDDRRVSSVWGKHTNYSLNICRETRWLERDLVIIQDVDTSWEHKHKLCSYIQRFKELKLSRAELKDYYEKWLIIIPFFTTIPFKDMMCNKSSLKSLKTTTSIVKIPDFII